MSTLRFLSRAEVAGLLPGIPEQLDLVERTYRSLAAGRVELLRDAREEAGDLGTAQEPERAHR